MGRREERDGAIPGHSAAVALPSRPLRVRVFSAADAGGSFLVAQGPHHRCGPRRPASLPKYFLHPAFLSHPVWADCWDCPALVTTASLAASDRTPPSPPPICPHCPPHLPPCGCFLHTPWNEPLLSPPLSSSLFPNLPVYTFASFNLFTAESFQNITYILLLLNLTNGVVFVLS